MLLIYFDECTYIDVKAHTPQWSFAFHGPTDLEELCHQLSETAVFVSESVQRAARDVYLRSWTITNTVRRCWGVFMIAAPSILTVLTYLHRHIGWLDWIMLLLFAFCGICSSVIVHALRTWSPCDQVSLTRVCIDALRLTAPIMNCSTTNPNIRND